MQQKLKTEEVAIMDNNSRPFYKPISLADDPKVQRARKVLIIILGVFCVISGMDFINAISETTLHSSEKTVNIVRGLVSFVFYGFAIIVAKRYSPTDLRIFALLCLLELVSEAIFIIALVAMGITDCTSFSMIDDVDIKSILAAGSMRIFITAIIISIVVILKVIISVFSFKLARLIDNNKRLTVQQI